MRALLMGLVGMVLGFLGTVLGMGFSQGWLKTMSQHRREIAEQERLNDRDGGW